MELDQTGIRQIGCRPIGNSPVHVLGKIIIVEPRYKEH